MGVGVMQRAVCRPGLAGAVSFFILTSSMPVAAGSLDDMIVEDGIESPLTDEPGRPAAGLSVFVDRQTGHCLLCHAVDSIDEPFQGNLGPDLSCGSTLSDAQLRLRLVDSTRINPQTVMPAYYRVEGLTQVADEYRNQPVLMAQQIEDLIAFVRSLRQPERCP